MGFVTLSILAAFAFLWAAKALSADTPLTLEIGDLNDYPVKASEVIYEGSMVGLAAGYARALTAGDQFVGHAIKGVTGTAADGGASVRVRSGIYRAVVTITSVAVTDVGKPVYASADGTYVITAGTASIVGKVIRYVTTNTAVVEFCTMGSSADGELEYSAVAASSALTNTTNETVLGTKTIDGAKLRAGDVIRVRAQGTATATNSTDTLTVKLYLGTEEIATTGAVDSANGDIFYIDADIVVRTIGASGTVVGCGVVANGVIGTVTAKPFLKASATEDISGDVAVAVKGTWSVASASNSCRLDVLNVQVLRR